MIINEPVRGAIPPPWFSALSGIDRMRAFGQRLLPHPPLSRLLGIRPAHVGAGSGTYTMPASGWFQMGTGALEISAFVEAALTGVVTTTLPPGVDVVPVTLTINYFRPGRPEPGNLLARARVVNASRFFTFSEVEVEDPQGRQIAHGASHARIRHIEPPPPSAPADPRPVEEPVYPTPDPVLRPVSGVVAPIEIWETRDGCSVMRLFSEEGGECPYQKLLGATISDVDVGRLVCTLVTSEWLCRDSRSLTAGVVAALANLAGTGGCLTLQRPGESFVGLEQSVHFHRAVPADGRTLRAEALATRHDEGRVLTKGKVYDADGVLVAELGDLGIFVESAKRQRRPAPAAKRILATLLFTDIVASTEHAHRLGDARWRALLDEHHRFVRREIADREGMEVKTIGDGFLVRFDSPARALECARAVRDGVGRLGIQIRAGIHTGECELQGGDLSGIAVHVAARVQAAASPGEIWVSRTVKDLAVGSAASFEDRGEHALKGVPGEWRLYALVVTNG